MTPTDTRIASHRADVQTAALVVGVIFLLVGILGFIPGVTTDYDQLAPAGPDSHALLFGIFQVSFLHNVVHLLFGVAGLALSRAVRPARQYLLWGGCCTCSCGSTDWSSTREAPPTSSR